MKKLLIISILFAACNSQSPKVNTAENTKDTVAVTAPVKKFAGVKFASTKDLGCGMPLSAGLEDTAHYKGKIYGFCSIECKNDFLKDPEGHLAKK